MPRLPLPPGLALLSLSLLPACSTPPAGHPQPLLTQRCPAVTACALPALTPKTNAQLADSWQQHRAALEACAAQINSIIHCQQNTP
ncbi:Rz1-like lysis system protein LysC [Chromobacterium sp. IIBBL 290-4]|uniref:Rz1-like lysis system protein LysC n=1 Tax=Chromobacterium sp. IIBBL 290-4 TaxID=2953890 RepID=UPI00353269C4